MKGLKNNPKKMFAAGAVFLFVLCLFLEGVCFQYSALKTRTLKPVPLQFSYDISGNECILEDLEIEDVKTIRTTFTGTPDTMLVELFASDDAHRFFQMPVNRAYVSPGDPGYGSATMLLDAHGALRGLGIYWERSDAYLMAVDLNVPVPYNFRVKRFLLMFVLSCAVLALTVFSLWDIVCDYRSRKHRLCYAACALLCVLFSTALFRMMQPYDESKFPASQRIAYPLEEPAETYKEMPHALLFDSLYNGVLYVRTEVDERLYEAENVFDFTQRIVTSGFSYDYWWDYAWFGDRLYVYFGITPVLVFYVPYYLLTGMLPSNLECSFFLALLTMAGGFLCFWELAKRYVKEVRLYALCLAASATVTGSQVFMLQSCPTRYCISGASAQAFFFLSVWMGLKATAHTGMWRRIRLVPSAVCTALIVTSRPTVALPAAGCLSVLFVFILLDKEHTAREKAADAAAYLIPVILCGIAVMAYNHARFGSPFDFGVKYQLTSWDMRYSTMSVAALPKALWHYLVEPLKIRTDFPWFLPNDSYINHTGNYVYANPNGNAGALVVPLVWGNLLFFARAKEKGQREWRALFAVSVACALLVCFLDYAIGGVSERYVCDVLPVLCMTGAICWLRVPSTGAGGGTEAEPVEAGVLIRRLFTIACVLTIVMGLARGCGNEMNALKSFAPQRYISLVETFTIW